MVIWIIGGNRKIRISLIFAFDYIEFGDRRMLYHLIRDFHLHNFLDKTD